MLWADDARRRAAAGILATLQFREKWRAALAQVRATVDAGVTIAARLPRRWSAPVRYLVAVAGDVRVATALQA